MRTTRSALQPSVALRRWNTDAQAALDEIESAHRVVGRSGRGRRSATLQMNHAYAMLLSSQFQGFCRDLHSEAVDGLVRAVRPISLGPVVHNLLAQGRRIDHGNPTPGNLAADFVRFGMPFWASVTALGRRNRDRRAALEVLNTWRNAVAHQDWSRVGPALRLDRVRAWRAACRGLASDFDRAVGSYLAGLVGKAPW